MSSLLVLALPEISAHLQASRGEELANRRWTVFTTKHQREELLPSHGQWSSGQKEWLGLSQIGHETGAIAMVAGMVFGNVLIYRYFGYARLKTIPPIDATANRSSERAMNRPKFGDPPVPPATHQRHPG